MATPLARRNWEMGTESGEGEPQEMTSAQFCKSNHHESPLGAPMGFMVCVAIVNFDVTIVADKIEFRLERF
jgi:hypothetical protein